MNEECIRQGIEPFFRQAKVYRETTLAHFGVFWNVDYSSLLQVFSRQQWTALRHTWALQRIRQAMDQMYASATFQSDFSERRVAALAGVDRGMILDLAESEFRRLKATLPTYRDRDEGNCLQAEQLLEQIASHQEWERCDTSQTSVAEQDAPFFRLTREQLQIIQDKRTLELIRQVMNELHSYARSQHDFTMEGIASQVGVTLNVVRRLAREEFFRLKTTLPTSQDLVLEALKTLVEANTPVDELTREKISATAGVPIKSRKWFRDAYRSAYLELVQRQQKQPRAESNPPVIGNGVFIHERWVNLESDSWDLRGPHSHGCMLKRERLRGDFAEIAWHLLREELLSGELALGTIQGHFTGFLLVGKLLETGISDIRQATLEAVQYAWVSFNGTLTQKKKTRLALLQLVEALIQRGESDLGGNQTEMIRIAAWLRLLVSLPSSEPGEAFLSEEELTKVLQVALRDISAGIAFVQDVPNLVEVNTCAHAEMNAGLVLRWAVALVIVVMACTGLRQQSILQLEIQDWMQIRHELFALVWRHGKKREEKLTVLPAVVAQHLDLYVERTLEVRAALGTQRVFLAGNNSGFWKVLDVQGFDDLLRQFSKRHHIEQDGVLSRLGSTLFRRTFATRAFYEGQNIWVLRSLLGHAQISTTARYMKRDRFEHPDQVRQPLEVYGRQSLTLWSAPLLLEDLGKDERMRILSVRIQRDQDVGLCRYDHCAKATPGGSLPPCSLCEHLVTGREFLPAWEAEHARREQELHELVMKKGAEIVLAQMKCQMSHFEANFSFVQERYAHEP
jgi:integrase